MSLSDIISIISAVISLIVAIIIAVIQYKQGKRMEDFSKKQDEEQKKAAAQSIKVKRDTFIMKYYNDKDEIYMLPLCWIAAIYDPAHAYHRKMYMEYNMLEEDVQKAICEYMHFNVIKPKNERDTFYNKCIEALLKEEHKYYIFEKNHNSIFYDNAKYFRKALERYGSKTMPIDLSILENRFTDLLCEYKEHPDKCIDPLKQFVRETNYTSTNTDEVDACEICCVMIKWIAEWNKWNCHDSFWIPGEYGYEKIETMEDLFLCALFCLYVYLIMPKNEGEKNDQT